ncbi:MAG: Na+/H+ antiporter subunit E [Candidatus Hecatellaceae archaeon]
MKERRENQLKLARFLIVFLALYSLWLLLVFTVRFDELVVGAAACAVVAYLSSGMMVRGEAKSKLNPARWFWALAYFVYYWLYFEVKAHLDVIKRIINPKMPLRPGIVKVPYGLKSDCGIVCVANSITNTPGTVTVNVDEAGKAYYVHWIWVVSPEPEVCRREISAGFEKYVRRFFD